MKKILIIGGGFTGLTAAKKLSDEGLDVTIVEKSEKLGGLAASFNIRGESLEKAYHHIFRTDIDIIDFIEELGIGDLIEWHESSVGILRNGKIWPFMTPLDLLKFEPVNLLGRIRIGLAALKIKRSRNVRDFSGTTALKWMQEHCGNSASENVWRPLLKGKFAMFHDQISMSWLWARLHVRSNSREKGGAKEKLGYIKHGFVRIAEAVIESLEKKGAKIFTETSIKNLTQEDRGKLSVLINGEKEVYDKVVFTGSNSSVKFLLPEFEGKKDYENKLSQIQYLGAMCLVFTTKQKLGDFYWVNVNEEDAPFLVFIRHTKLIDKSRYQGEEVYYIGAYCPQEEGIFKSSNEEIKETWYKYLSKIFPSFSQDMISEDHLFKFKDAQHIVTQGYEEKILPYETPIRNLFLSNFTQVFPEDRGTNFAVREGKKVAEKVLSSI